MDPRKYRTKNSLNERIKWSTICCGSSQERPGSQQTSLQIGRSCPDRQRHDLWRLIMPGNLESGFCLDPDFHVCKQSRVALQILSLLFGFPLSTLNFGNSFCTRRQKHRWCHQTPALPTTPGGGWACYAYHFSSAELVFGLAAVIIKKSVFFPKAANPHKGPACDVLILHHINRKGRASRNCLITGEKSKRCVAEFQLAEHVTDRDGSGDQLASGPTSLKMHGLL